MVRLIISIAILVVLAILLLFNGTYMTPINLFGYRFERVSVAVVGIVGFVLGLLYSFLLYLMRFLSRRRSKAIQSKDENVRLREQGIKEKEMYLDSLAGDLDQAQGGPAGGSADLDTGVPEPSGAGRRALRPRRKKKLHV